MDGNKHVVPNLPDTQYILEDLSDPEIVKLDPPLDLSADDAKLQNAYACYISYKQLESDMEEQSEYHKRLDELNTKLVENIGNMKAQTKTSLI